MCTMISSKLDKQYSKSAEFESVSYSLANDRVFLVMHCCFFLFDCWSVTDTMIILCLLGRSGITHMAWPTESRLWIRSARLQNTVIAFSASSSFTLWEEVSFWCLACYPWWWLRNIGWPKCTFVCLGTGSGLGTFVLKLLEDEFPEVYRIVTSVYPTAEDDVITSPYNSVLAMKELTEHADCVLPVDNQVQYLSPGIIALKPYLQSCIFW